MSLSVERLKHISALADSALASAVGLNGASICLPPSAITSLADAARELIAIKEAELVYCVPEEVVGEAGPCIKYGHYENPPPLCDFFVLIRKPE